MKYEPYRKTHTKKYSDIFLMEYRPYVRLR